MKNLILTALTLTLLFAGPAFSAQRLVPLVYDDIQAAIDAAGDGDTVLIAPGKYTGPGNRNIDLKGKRITVRSTNPANPQIVDATVIDCQGLAPAFMLRTGEGPDSVIAGLTITNGRSTIGAGIYCLIGVNPVIQDCVITNCSAFLGGGAIACGGDSGPAIVNCTMTNNSALMGGALYSNAGRPAVFNSLIVGNTAGTGGAFYCTSSSCRITNCTLSGNSSGIYSSGQADVTVMNSILWSNTPGPELFVSKSGNISVMTVSYCDVQGGRQAVVVEDGCILSWAFVNQNIDPAFAAGPFGDYYLQPSSPCVNAGSQTAVSLGLDSFTTSVEGTPDVGAVDLAYHRHLPNVTIDATVDVRPNTINLAANGNWVTCSIRLPEGYDVADIDPRTVRFQDDVAAERVWLGQLGVAMAKFDRSQVASVIGAGSAVEITVSGLLTDGTIFKGTDSVKVLNKGAAEKSK
jgi:parallel beta-helix repeat protein